MKKIFLFILCFLAVGGLFSLIWISRRKPSPPNVILISIDTLRADHLGCYGYERNTSPHLDSLAKESICFEANFAPSSSTTPSHVSMLTSLYPLAHGVLSNLDPRAYSEDIVSMTQILKDNGFLTAGFVGGAGVSRIKGLDRGFDQWSEERFIAQHLPKVMDWIRQNTSEQFFLFFHFYDVHAPYVFREDFIEMYHNSDDYEELKSKIKKILDAGKYAREFYNQLTIQEKLSLICFRLLRNIDKTQDRAMLSAAQNELPFLLMQWRKSPEFKDQLQLIIDSYDAGIQYADHYLGEFFSLLRSLNLWENTLLIVTSDHGEEFMEHNMVRHGFALYDTLIHVPLIIKMPRSYQIAGRRLSYLTELVDIMPTVLDVLGIEFKEQMQGKSLWPIICGQKTEEKSIIFASYETTNAPKKRAIRTDRWKYIIHDMDFSDKDEFFDIKHDPKETGNLISQKSSPMTQLKSYLSHHIWQCHRLYNTRYSKKRKTEKDYPEAVLKKHLEILRALGYIH